LIVRRVDQRIGATAILILIELRNLNQNPR
jgi:hypothetical protein